MALVTIMDLYIVSLLLCSWVLICKATATPQFKVMKFTSEPSDVVVKRGASIMLPCSATYDSRSPSAYSWKRNNVLLTPWNTHQSAERTRYMLTNGSLLFSSVTPSGSSPDPGFYKCIAEVTESSKVHRIATPQVQLSLAEMPKFLSQPKDLVLLAGETAMFRCDTGGQPRSKYKWLRDGSRVAASSRLLLYSEGEVLEIRSVNSSDVGQYRCRAENVVGHVQSASASLSVVSRTTQDTSGLESLDEEPGGVGGDNSSSIFSSIFGLFGFGGGKSSDDETTVAPTIQLESTLTTFPAWVLANFSWHSPSEKLDNASLSPPTPHARIPLLDVPQSHLGTDFIMKPWDVSAAEGSTVILFCAVNGTDNSLNLPTVTWLKHGSTIDTSAGDKFSITGSASLQIRNVSLADDGMYTCRGENLEDVADATARLTVQVPPYFVKVPHNTYGRVNEDIILECEVAGTPAPHVVWLKDSDEIKPSRYFKYIGHNLKILGLMPTDAAYYQCMASNELGNIYTVAQLIVLDTDIPIPNEHVQSFPSAPLDHSSPPSSALPQRPYDLQAAITSHTFVTLTWSMRVETWDLPVIHYTVTTQQLGESRLRVVNTTTEDCTVEGLLAHTTYKFTVRSYNQNGYSASAELNVTTDAEVAVPQAVRNVHAWATSYESIVVRWQPPSVTNGPVIKYRVFFNSQNQPRELHVQTNGTTVTLNDLQAYTDYYIRVVAYNRNGQGMPTTDMSVRTISAKPSAPPSNVTLEVSGATSVVIRWLPPPDKDQNGIITGYKIRYKRNGDNRAKAHITDADARSFEITELAMDSPYVVRIAAVNINGSGEFTPWSDITPYDAELDETRPPGKPTFIQLKAFAREMIVSWGPTEDADEVLVRGYRIGYGIGIPESNWINNISPSSRIYSLNHLVPLKNYVVQVMAYNNAGQGASAEQLVVTSESTGPDSSHPEGPMRAPLAVEVRAISSTAVMVTWYDNTLGENQKQLDDRVYTIKYNALAGSDWRRTQYKNTTELFANVDGLRPYTKYEFSVMCSKGNRASIYSLAARNTTLEDKPNDSPQDLTVTLIDNRPNMVMISWQPPNNPNGRIISYTIYSTTEYEQPLDNWIVEDVQGHVLNHEFGPVTPSTLYFFRIAAHNSRGASPPSSTFTLHTPALSAFHKSRLQEPGGPEPKPKIVQQTPKPGSGVPSAETLWIIIGGVSTVTVLAIAALVVVLCRRKIMHNRRKPANLKATNQAPKGMNKNNKQNGGNLWINHEQVEMKALNKEMEPPDIIDESTSMLQSHGSHFDVTSASMMGDGYMHIDEPRYCTLGRQRPVIIAPYQNSEAMPRAAVQPMSNGNSRPLYPRTQFATHNPGSVPRVHMGDTSQPATEIYGSYVGIETSSFCTDPLTGLTGVATPVNGGFTNGELEAHNHATSTPFYNKPYMINGEEVPPPRPPPMESRSHPLRSFNNTNGTGHTIPKHIVKPQPVSAFKPAVQPPSDQLVTDTDSLKRPPRPPYANRQRSQGSLGPNDSLKMSLKTGSTEQLNTDMANLDNIMQDLNSMKSEFQCAA